ncbi:MAG: hypothetical protein GF331_24625 [Chitinivibrionales bacterium]|nr:hypothetical protein [Chitinivibrionales bacterium]
MRYLLLVGAAGLLFLLGCTDDVEDSPEGSPRLRVSLTYSGPVYEGTFYNGFLPPTDHAIWIQDADGRYVTTLLLNESIVTVGQHGAHLSHVPTWTAVRGETDSALEARMDTVTRMPPEYDAVTGASVTFYNEPKGDTDQVRDTTLTVEWDFTDYTGAAVAPGTYQFCAEVANIHKDSVPGVAFPPDSIIAESCCGSVIVDGGPVTDASPTTAHIQALTAEIVD